MDRQQECSDSLGILEESAHDYVPALGPGTTFDSRMGINAGVFRSAPGS